MSTTTFRVLGLIALLLIVAIVLWPVAGGGKVAQQARDLVGHERIILFSAQWCGYCDRLRTDLQQAGVRFAERDIEASVDNNNAWRSLGGRGVPLTLIGDDVVSGYAPAQVLSLARELP